MTEPRIVSLIASATEIVCALGRPERAERLTAEMTGRLDALRERSGRLAERPTVACIEWIDPLMHAENWVQELVEIAGGSVMPPLAAHPGWSSLSAVRNGRVFLTDGNQCHPSAR